MKRNIITIAVILILVGVALYTNLSGKSSSNVERPEAGFKAPDFELTALDNRTYHLNEVSKPVVINFWASWCGPCREEAPSLTKLYKKYHNQVEFLAVNLTVNDQMENVKSFVKQYQFSFPILLDKEGKVSDQYQIVGIPTSIFVDQDKHIVKVVSGLHSEGEFEQMILQLIPNK